MNQIVKFAFPLLLTFIASGCDVKDDLIKGERLADSFYAIVATGDVDQIIDEYSEEFFSSTSEAEWRRMLKSVYSQAGSYTDHEVINTVIAKILFSGTTIKLEVRVRYESKVTLEYLTFKGFGELRLVKHFIVLDQKKNKTVKLTSTNHGTVLLALVTHLEMARSARFARLPVS